MLAGKFKSVDDLDKNDWRRNNPRFQGDNFKKNLAVVDEIEKLATKKGVAPAQLCLAWVLAQGEDIIPIPGTSSVKNLEQNWGALKISLSPEEVAEIRKAVDALPVLGDRYDSVGMATLNK